MKTKNYEVNIDDIYIGELVKVKGSIKRFSGKSDYFYNDGELYLEQWERYRSMLFVLDKNKKANDLLYNSPKYPILNITNDLLIKEPLVIQDAYSISILKYFLKKDTLTYKDLLYLKRKYLNGHFIRNNEVFFKNKRMYTVIDDLGNRTLKEYFLWREKMNSFKPSKKEYTRKLSR